MRPQGPINVFIICCVRVSVLPAHRESELNSRTGTVVASGWDAGTDTCDLTRSSASANVYSVK